MNVNAAETAETAGPLYYKPAEVAARLNISRRTVYELLASGALDGVRIGPPGTRGALRVPAENLHAYETRLRAGA